jgi:uncharacterized protein YjbJ (UPF0337 family)
VPAVSRLYELRWKGRASPVGSQKRIGRVLCLVNREVALEIQTMSGKLKEIKGRAKQSAGVLMKNQKLKNEGRAEKVSGKIKQAVTRTVDKVKKAVKGNKA